MKVTIKSTKNSDSALVQSIDINGLYGDYIAPLYETPEDATLERDMINADRILHYMELAYKAGRNHEDFDVVRKTVDDIEDL